MKNFFKGVMKFLINIVLIGIMLTSAQHCMNLPFGWTGIGYFGIFLITLTLWKFMNDDNIQVCNIGLLNISITKEL